MLPRRVCFVTGSRAEYGLMRSTLSAMHRHPALALQVVVTGLHLDPTRGSTAAEVYGDDWPHVLEVPWPQSTRPSQLAAATGVGVAGIANAFTCLRPDVVLVVGDRVEALAAAVAGHLSGLVVAHVHGGDRAAGQADDAMRHAITKLTHVHLAATESSFYRILRLGEDAWRVHLVGTPGLDGITAEADATRESALFALIVLHPTRDDPDAEHATADRVLRATLSTGVSHVRVVWPNADVGASGIERRWREAATDPRVRVERHVPRSRFLAMMRDATLMIGNSSAGLIEAGAFGTPVVDVGDRQAGRDRPEAVIHADDDDSSLAAAITAALRPVDKRPSTGAHSADGAGMRIAGVLADLEVSPKLLRKLITY